MSDRSGATWRSAHYDRLLAAIPIPLVAGWAVSTLTGIWIAYGLGVGAAVSAALVGYALFVATPTSVWQEAQQNRTDETP